MSFSEKYRGTEWGLPLEEPVAPPPSRGRAIGRFIVSLFAIVVLVGLVGAGAWLYLGSQQGSALGPGADPSAEPTTEASVPRDRFIDLMSRQPPLPMHVAFQMTVATGSTEVLMSGEMNMAGDDSAGWMTLATADGSATIDYVILADKTYLRQPGGAWQLGPQTEAMSYNFSVDELARADLTDLGLVERDGRSLYQLRARRFPDELERRLPGMVESSRLDVFVTDLGVPVAMETDVTLRVEKDRQRASVELRSVVEISRFSKPVKITAPEP